MGKNKGLSGQGKGRSALGRGGGSKTLPLDQKWRVGAVDEGKGTPSAHKHDLNSIQNSQVVQQMQEADPSSSGLQARTCMKRSGESECKEVTPDSSISAGCEMSDIWHCTEFRVIVKAMMDTHPQKDDYVAKIEEHCIEHAVGWRQMLEGPSGEQKSKVQSSDVESSVENQSVDLLPAEPSSCHDMGEENRDQHGHEQLSSLPDAGKEDKEQDEQEVVPAVAEERSSAKENQAAGGGHGGEEESDDYDPGWNGNWPDRDNRRKDADDSWDRSDNQKGEQDKDNCKRKEDCDRQDRNKRRNEDSHSWDRSGKQKGRQYMDSWRGQDRGMGAEKYCRSAGDGGGRGRSMQYRIVKEVDGDLFTAPKEWSLAHCVATDMRMGSGIAVNFRQTFKNVGDLLDQGARVGHIAVLEHEGRYIYYLVTKKYSTDKPRFEDLVSSLQKMRDHCAEHEVKNLAMPRIGCGLDRLEWREVKPKIEELFSGLDISITIYNFNQPEKEEDSHYQRKKHLPVSHRSHRLVTIESETALLFFGSEDGSVDKCGEDLDRKFNFLLEYKKQNKVVGDVIRLEKRNEVLYGLIVRKKESDAFSYINFEKCLSGLRKMVRKDRFVYVGVEAFYESNDSDTMEKVITVMKCVLTDPNLQLFVCWPEELEHCRRENV